MDQYGKVSTWPGSSRLLELLEEGIHGTAPLGVAAKLLSVLAAVGQINLETQRGRIQAQKRRERRQKLKGLSLTLVLA